MSLAQRVRDFRYSKGWGPDELANRAEISRTALYQIESGKTELPRAATLRRIALALDVSMDALLGHAAGAVNARESFAAATAVPRGRAAVGEGSWNPRPSFNAATIEDPDGSFLALGAEDCGSVHDPNSPRMREVFQKLQTLLASPLGEGVVRIIEELHRSLPAETAGAPRTNHR
jgi:transcriptional regulator with XRE-family HTH domain